MKKFSLFIIVLLLIVFFAGADYLVNTPRIIDQDVLQQLSGENTLRQITQETRPQSQTEVNRVKLMLSVDPEALPYTLEKRARVRQLFEAFDISSVANIQSYRNLLTPSADEARPIIVYEINGPKNQGKVTYLNIRLSLLAQIGPTGSINETNDFGESSLFYNEDNNQNIAFLLVQIDDSLYGFQYDKQNESAFRDVGHMITTLTALSAN